MEQWDARILYLCNRGTQKGLTTHYTSQSSVLTHTTHLRRCAYPKTDTVPKRRIGNRKKRYVPKSVTHITYTVCMAHGRLVGYFQGNGQIDKVAQCTVEPL